MGQEYDASKSRRSFPQNFVTLLLVLLVIVTANVVVLYAFSRTCNCPTASFPSSLDSSSQHQMARLLNSTLESAAERELAQLRAELKALHVGTERLIQDRTQSIWDELKARQACTANDGGIGLGISPTNPWAKWASGELPQEMKRFVEPRPLPMGWSSTLGRSDIMAPVGHGCAVMEEELELYMSYEVGKECPDDEEVTQKLLVGGCEPLPRRRCFAVMPKDYTEPLPVPEAFWEAQGDDKIVWTPHTCKSFDCLRNRVREKAFADCLDCFNLEGREKSRWINNGSVLDYQVAEVVRMKNGTLRIGLDLGGGTGTFAVRMREEGVIIITSTLNLNGPFNNFVALRGMLPMYMTVSQRLPFFDNTLDIVHSMHVLSNWIPPEMLEFILFDIDRILRPGGLFWLDHFFCVRSQLPIYEPLIEQLGYTKLRWNIGDKLDRGKDMQEVYVSGLLEKPTRRFSSM